MNDERCTEAERVRKDAMLDYNYTSDEDDEGALSPCPYPCDGAFWDEDSGQWWCDESH
jgi:hypothetical protein